MFAFVYFFCAIISLVYFVTAWDKSRNKLKVFAGIVLSLIPLLNLVVTIVVLTRWWPSISKWIEKNFE